MKITRYWETTLKKHLWKFDFTLKGRRYRDQGFSSREMLDAAVSAIRLRAMQDKYELPRERVRVTLAELVAEHTRALDPAKQHTKGAQRVLKQFCAYFPDNQAVEALTTADVRAFIDYRILTSRLRPRSSNRELDYISVCLHRAGDYFPALENWKPPRLPYRPVAKKGAGKLLPRENALKLLDAMREPRQTGEAPQTLAVRLSVADLLEVALLTAMRPGELRGLAKERLDWHANVIKVTVSRPETTETKTGEDRLIPMSARVREILEARCRTSRSRWVFTGWGDNQPLAANRLYAVLKRYCARLQIPYGQLTEDGFTPHVTRHTATTEMLRNAADIATVQAVTGHSDRTMLLLYGHATRASVQRAVDALAGFTQGPNEVKTEEDSSKS